MEGTSFEDILSSEEPEAEGGQPRDEHGRFASQETVVTQEPVEQELAPAEVTTTSEPEPGHIPIAALKDERAKRQAMEEQFRQANERLQQYESYYAQQQPGAQPEQEQDPIEFIAQQVMGRLQPQTEAQMLTMRVNVAEEFARQKWQDYDEKVELFKEAAAANPFLVEEMKRSANPAEYAYNAAQKINEARTYGTATPSREQIEAEIREKIMAEIGMKPQAPTSLIGTQSRGTRAGPAWTGPSSMGEILGR